MKKHLTVFLFILLLLTASLSVSTFATSSGTLENGVKWTLNNDVLIISGEGPIEGSKVYGTTVPSYPWPNTITTVVVQSGITTVGSYAFHNCTNLTSVELPNTVTLIDDYAFSGCTALKNFYFPDNLKEIGIASFSDCTALTSVWLPDSFSLIGNYAFKNCSSMTDFIHNVPYYNTFDRRGVFYGCSSLKTFTFPDTARDVATEFFYGCSSLNNITLPDTIERIGSEAFFGCTSLTTINFPEDLGQIKNGAFYNCSSLNNIQLPTKLYTLEFSCFYGCSSLTSITLPRYIQSVPSYAFYNCTSLTEVILPNNITEIESYAFQGCSALRSISLPKNLETIKSNAFNSCTALSEIQFPSSVYAINGYAFRNCTALTSIMLPEKLITISEGMFYDCTALTEIYIPSRVQFIEIAAFKNCNALKTVHYSDTPEDWNKIDVEDSNDCLYGATIRFIDNTELKPDIPNGPAVNTFTDVNDSDWFYRSVIWAKENGITGGTSDTTFSPNNDCTRAQVVTFLWAANGKPEPTSTINPFTDVKASDWYCKAVLWAVEKGITGGTSPTTFSPNSTCTRAQIVTFLYAAQGRPAISSGSTFTDVNNSDWFAAPVIWAGEKGVTGGIGNNQFGPNNNCTRAQVVTFLYKVYG